jgi:hypothetical protein
MRFMPVCFAVTSGVLLFLGACSGTSPDASGDSLASMDARDDAFTRDASTDDAASPSTVDGTASRVACTSSFGNGLSPGGFGRLDGVVAAVVPPGKRTCSGDKRHVHIQVLSGGETYDVAVNVDGGFVAEKAMKLPGAAWSEGWHAHASLSYTSDLGLHSGDFDTGSQSVIDQRLEAALASANHISVFGNTYSRGGVHLIHRHLGNDDGAVVLDPLAAQARVFAFHFSNQSF